MDLPTIREAYFGWDSDCTASNGSRQESIQSSLVAAWSLGIAYAERLLAASTVLGFRKLTLAERHQRIHSLPHWLATLMFTAMMFRRRGLGTVTPFGTLESLQANLTIREG